MKSSWIHIEMEWKNEACFVPSCPCWLTLNQTLAILSTLLYIYIYIWFSRVCLRAALWILLCWCFSKLKKCICPSQIVIRIIRNIAVTELIPSNEELRNFMKRNTQHLMWNYESQHWSVVNVRLDIKQHISALYLWHYKLLALLYDMSFIENVLLLSNSSGNMPALRRMKEQCW